MKDATNLDRLTIAFDVAERALSIPRLLEALDLLSDPDEQCILTYLSYFRAHLNRPVNLLADSKLQAEMEDLRRQFEEESSQYKDSVEALKQKLQRAELNKLELEKLQHELDKANKEKQQEVERQKKIEDDVQQLKELKRIHWSILFEWSFV